MRNFLLLAFLCLHGIAFGQISFQKTYTIPALSDQTPETTGFALLSNGGSIVATNPYLGATPENDVVLIVTDSTGTSSYGHRIDNASDRQQFVMDVIGTPGGGYCVAWRQRYNFACCGLGKWEIHIAKFDSQGNGLWEKRFNGTNNHFVDGAKLSHVPNGDILVSLNFGFVFSSSTGIGWNSARLNGTTGNVTEIRSHFGVINNSGSGYGTAGDIAGTSDGGALVCGRTDYGVPERATIGKLNSSHSPTWYREFDGPGYEIVTEAEEAVDGSYLWGGTASGFDPAAPSKTEFFIAKTSNTGTKLWLKVFRYSGSGSSSILDMKPTRDSGAVAIFDTPMGNGMVKMTANGDIDWIQAPTDNSSYVELEQDQDGWYWVGTTGPNGGDPAILKISPSGNSACGDTTYAMTAVSPFLPFNNQNALGANGGASWFATNSAGTIQGLSALVTTTTTSCSGLICQAQADFAPSATQVCEGGSLTFTNNSTGASSFNWMVDGVPAGSTQNLTQTFNTVGNQVVMLVAGNGSCSDTTSLSVNVTANPTPSITGGGNLCDGDTAVLSAGSFSTYQWTGNQSTSSISVTSTGTYSVTVTDGNGCSGNSSPATVTFNPLPIPSVSSAGTTFCDGDTASLSTGSFSSYLWTPGNETSGSIDVTTSGAYSVAVVDGNGCAGSSAPVTLTFAPSPSPTVSASGSTTICDGDTLVLTTGAFSGYVWTPGSATSASLNVTSSGAYSVEVTDTNGCTGTSMPTTVTVNPAPAPSISSSSSGTPCDGDTITLSTGNFASYNWAPGNQNQGSIEITSSGTFTVEVVDGNGCVGTSSPFNAVFNSLPAPVVSASGATTFCEGDSVILTTGAFSSYMWNPNGQISSAIVASDSGVYSVMVTDANGCVGVSNMVAVEIAETPTAGFFYGVNSGDVTLQANTIGTISTYQWTFGDGNSSTFPNPTHTYNSNGTYQVCLTVTNPTGCSDIHCDSVSITGVAITEATLAGEMMVYPNPTLGDVKVRFEVLSSVDRAELIDLNGRVIWKLDIDGQQSAEFNVPLSGLAAGIYAIRLAGPEGALVKRVIRK